MEFEALARAGSLALGLGLVGLVLYDIGYSTLSARGAGPLLRGAALPTWYLIRRLALPTRHSLLGFAGPAVVVTGFTAWMVVMWAGWSLVFLGGSDAVLAAQTRVPADWVERIYYAGFSMTTLGAGDYVASGAFWQILTVLAALSGFSAVTLTVTFLLSLLSAVAEKRAVADLLWSLGASPHGLITEQGTNGGTQQLLEYGPTLTQALASLAQKYTAYPLLQYYHATEPRVALSLRVAALSEALLFLESGALASSNSAATVRPLRRSLDSLLTTLDQVYLPRIADAPELPDLRALARRVRIDETADLAGAAAAQRPHRQLLLAFVERDGWSWRQVGEDPVL